MADKKITINATPSKVKSVNVTNATVANQIVATPDTSLYYSNLSKQWATKMDGKVVNDDYSSKYYAENAKISAETAKMEANSINGLIPELQENFNNYNSTLNETADNAITEINTNRDYAITQVSQTSLEAIENINNAVSDIEITKNESVNVINATKTTSVQEINTAKTTALSQITTEGAEQIANIESTGFYMRGDKLYFINSEGVETEFESGSGYALGDIVQKDHILSFEESEGLALLGTYVYKEALAGSRYGYPDFYEKYVAEYKESTEKVYHPWTQPIATGATTAIDGGDMVITASSSNDGTGYNYSAYKAMDGVSSGTNIESGWGVKNTTAVQWWQVKFPYKIRITGLTGYQKYDSTPSSANTVGRFYTSSAKTTPIGNEYNNAVGVSWNAVSVTGIPAEGIITDTIYFEKTGGSAYGGLGELKIQATLPEFVYKNANGHTFYSISQKSYIDSIYESTGVAWFYGIDEENERIFLPRNDYYFKNGSTVDVGEYVEAGLPNITGTYKSQAMTLDTSVTANGALYKYANDGYHRATGTAGTGSGIGFDASKSNSIYGNSDTVQPPSVNVLAYMVVGNTKSTEGLSEVVNQGMEILEQVNQGIESRVNLDATNLSIAGKKLITDYSFPSSKYIDIEMGASGSTYTAPANGWFAFTRAVNSAHIGHSLYNTSSLIGSSCHSTTTGGQTLRAHIPVKQGDTIAVGWGGTNIGTYTFRFIYAEGEV